MGSITWSANNRLPLDVHLFMNHSSATSLLAHSKRTARRTMSICFQNRWLALQNTPAGGIRGNV